MKDTRSQRYDVGEPDPEYVSLEDLTTLAMNKIESLSVEGLRIQSGMFNKDALSNISPQSIGEISALTLKGRINRQSVEQKGVLFNRRVALAAALDIRPLDKRNKVAIRGYYKRWSSCRCLSSIKYFPPTPGPAQHVSSDGLPFSSPGLSSDRIGRIWIFFKLRDLEEMQNLLTKFYLAFLESCTLGGTDNQEKDEKQRQNDKTGLGMEKTVKDKAKSKPESQSSQKVNRKVNRKVNWSKSKSTQVNPGAKVKEI
ncbi:plastid movement impaired 1-related 1 protein [Tanacetum coccineum]